MPNEKTKTKKTTLKDSKNSATKILITNVNFNNGGHCIPAPSSFKLIICMPDFEGDLPFYPNGHERAGEIINGYEGKEDSRGIFFQNKTDDCGEFLAATKGIIIYNLSRTDGKEFELATASIYQEVLSKRVKEINNDQSKSTDEKVREVINFLGNDLGQAVLEHVKAMPNTSTKTEIFKNLKNMLKTPDFYNSNEEYFKKRVEVVSQETTPKLQGKNMEVVLCQPKITNKYKYVYLKGNIQLEAEAAADPQQFEDGCVIVCDEDGKNARGVQPEIFIAHYRTSDGQPITEKMLREHIFSPLPKLLEQEVAQVMATIESGRTGRPADQTKTQKAKPSPHEKKNLPNL